MMQCYDAAMRTTLDSSASAHAGLTDLAKQKGKSMSTVANDLPEGVYIDPATGLAKITLDRQYTMEEIAILIDEDD